MKLIDNCTRIRRKAEEPTAILHFRHIIDFFPSLDCIFNVFTRKLKVIYQLICGIYLYSPTFNRSFIVSNCNISHFYRMNLVISQQPSKVGLKDGVKEIRTTRFKKSPSSLFTSLPTTFPLSDGRRVC
jgi:hypothetical protein